MELSPVQLGLSSSHTSYDLSCVVGAGMDTVSFAWRTSEKKVWNRIWEAQGRDDLEFTRSSRDPYLMKLQNTSPGVTWLFWRKDGLIAVEGRLTSILGAPDAGLTSPGELLRGVAAAVRAWRRLFPDIVLPERCTARRLDIAVDFFLPMLMVRSAIQRVVEAQIRVHGQAKAFLDLEGPATVLLAKNDQSRSVLAAYDKGREEQQDYADGGVLRLERRDRPGSDRQTPVERLMEVDFARQFSRRLATHFADLPPLYELHDAMTMLTALGASGNLKPQIASRLVGEAFAVEQLGKQRWPCQRTVRRGLEELRSAGLDVIEQNGRLYCRPGPTTTMSHLLHLASEAIARA